MKNMLYAHYVILLLLVWGAFVSGPALASTGGDAIIYPNAQGQLISGWGFDIKWAAKANDVTPSFAQTLFQTDKMEILRLPIWGTDSWPAHPSPGVVIDSYYEDTLYAMTNARAARPDVILFASKKLHGQASFPAWVKDGNGIVPFQYAILLADFLEYMEGYGFVIDVLGIDNEMEYNEGNITPSKHKQTIDELRLLAQQRGFTVPLLIGPETYGPKADWVDTLIGSGWGDTLDIVGTHYYPQWRPLTKLQNLVAEGQGRPVWHSEVHWKNDDNKDVIEEGEQCLAAIFDCFDEGLSSMTWWAYTRTGIKGEIEREITASTAETRPIDMDDVDGSSVTIGQLITRAFRGQNGIVVWACNTTSNDYLDYGFELATEIIHGSVSYIQWDPTTTTTGDATVTHDDRFELTLPANTITVFEFGFSDDYDPPTPDPMAWAVFPYAVSQTSLRMTATTAVDMSGVEYYFECTAGGGHDSGWQSSSTYTDTGLSPDSAYTYRVKTRDKSWNHNETGYSDQQSGTTMIEQWPFGPVAFELPGRLEAEDYDHGGQEFAYWDSSPGNSGLQYRSDDVDIQLAFDNDDGYTVWTGNSEWLEYTVDVPKGYYGIDLRVASAFDGRGLGVLLEGQEIGVINVPNTNGFTNWQTITLGEGLHLEEGTNQILALEFSIGGFNVNWINFRWLSEQWPYHGSPFIPHCRIQAEDFDAGGPSAAYFDTSAGNLGGADYRTDEDVDIQDSQDIDAGYSVWISAGEWLEYTLDPNNGPFALEVRAGCAFDGRTMHVMLDGQPVGTIEIPNTGDSFTYQTSRFNGIVLNGTDNHVLRLEMPNGGFNLNWIDLVEPSACEAAQLLPGYVSLAGDFNSDCLVGMMDFEQLADSWLNPYDLSDFTDLSTTWLDQNILP